MEVHDAVTTLLKEEGIESIFTYMSEDIMRLIVDIDEDVDYDVDIVHSRHEQGAIAMADGYARAHDEVGIALVGRGPAIAQTGTALITAQKHGSNLLVLVPETPNSLNYGHVSTHDIKEFEQEDFLESTIENVVSVRNEQTLLADLKEGFRQLKIGNGPVAVQVPWDLLDGEIEGMREEIEKRIASTTEGLSKRPPRQPDEELVEKAAEMYLDSDAFQPPVILAGRGAVKADAKDALEELARRTNGLLATTLQARNYFEGHPFNLGVAGNWGSDLTSKYFNDARLVFAVGCSLNPYTLDKGHLIPDKTEIIHIDSAVASINKFEEVDLGIVGDARATAEAIVAELESAGIDRGDELWTDTLRDEIADYSELDGREYPDKPDRMDPRALMKHLDALLPEDRLVVADSGHHTRWVTDGISTPPENFVLTLDFAAVGLGTPVGVGAAHGTDTDTCVTFCGDGGFMMSLPELESAVRHDIPIIVVVVNDQGLGSEYHTLEVSGYSGELSLLSSPDFAAVARSFGAEGHTVRSIDELRELEAITHRPQGPVVVDCQVDHEVRHRSKR